MNQKTFVRVNEKGLRIGQDHHNAILSDRDVELLFQLRAQGYGYKRISVMLEISKSHARNICKGRSRCQTATRFREVKL